MTVCDCCVNKGRPEYCPPPEEMMKIFMTESECRHYEIGGWVGLPDLCQEHLDIPKWILLEAYEYAVTLEAVPLDDGFIEQRALTAIDKLKEEGWIR